ncbi:SnoaL-like polyketide cyclase [bacterium BMS3Abin03]|nr:SnoaL-like polyketide cyclase [bacterium BMS3Abin03]HDZ58734.1 hypothetical protein [Ignavibacteriales bacterium]
MTKSKKILLWVFSFFIVTALSFISCQQQEERTYTDAELQTMMDNLNQIWTGGDTAVIDTMYAKDAVRHNADINNQKGPGEIAEFVKWVYVAYPDFKVIFSKPMKLKDRVIFEWTAMGTNTGPLNENMPATGKSVQFNGISVVKIENGKCTEEWVYYNQLPVYTQMGFKLVPAETEEDG